MKRLIFWTLIFYFVFASNALASEKRECDDVSVTPTAIISSTSFPSPSPTDTPIPQPGGYSPSSEGNNSTTNPPAVASCTISFSPATQLQFKRISSTQVLLKWWPSTDNVDFESVDYGYSPINRPYGEILPKNTGITMLSYLKANTVMYVEVCEYRNGCASCTPVIDP